MSIAEKLLTVEEYQRLPDPGIPTELVQGKVVRMNPPTPRHGQVCMRIARVLDRYLEEHPLGELVSNDAGIIIARNPDTVRGADVAFYSHERVPRGPLPQGYLPVVPEVVFEVRSAEDRWHRLLAKTAEYLEAGVSIVCVLDPFSETLHIYTADQPAQVVAGDQEFRLPEVLPGFRCQVAALLK